VASDRATLKAFFETGDFPSEGQYADFIDSAPNIDDDYNSSPAFDVFTKTSLTAAQARNLSSTPQTLVSAGGAGKLIALKWAAVRLNFTAPVFALNSTLNFTFPSANLAQMILTGIFNSTVSTFRNTRFPTFFLVDQTSLVENEDLILETSADSAAGGSSLDVFTIHNLVTL